MAIKSIIDQARGLKELEKRTLSVAYTRMMSMLGDLSEENIQEVLGRGIKKSKIKSLTHIYFHYLECCSRKRGSVLRFALSYRF